MATSPGSQRPERTTLLLAAACLVLLVASCGSSDEGEPGGAGSSPPAPEETIEVAGVPANDHGRAAVPGDGEVVRLGDVFFAPTVLVGEPGRTHRIRLENVGQVDHTFTIRTQDLDVTLRPGASEAAEVTFPQSGEVLFVCRFHEDAGMRGALRVGRG